MKQNQKRHGYYFIGLLIVMLLAGYSYFLGVHRNFMSIKSFDECIKAGYEKILTYPEECRIPGKRFVNQRQKVVKPIEEQNNYQNQVYIIEGNKVAFSNGTGTLPPNKLEKRYATTTLVVTSLTAKADINTDKSLDTILVLEGRRTNTSIYYISASISLHNGFIGLNALPIDDSIEFATLVFKDNTIIIEYTKVGSTDKKSKKYIFENDILRSI